ncbi:MAG TPA: hypothetical protein VKN99_07365 [Polyangia bacterium]|nr:hypothetical protein [Polyangia bacterium]
MRSLWGLATALLLFYGCGDDTGAQRPDAPAGDAGADRPADSRPPDSPPPVDAAGNQFSDAGDFATPVSDGSVFCGAGSIGSDCQLPGQTCCFNMNNPFGNNCVSAGADAGPCTFDLPCDGREDCPTGQSCCIRFVSQSVVSFCTTDNCVTTGAMTSFACHSYRECPQALQACCRLAFSIAGTEFATHFGVCLPPNMVPMLPMGQWQCDIP